MGALGRARRRVEGVEAQAIGEREFERAIVRAARVREMTPKEYVRLVLMWALEADGIIHVERKAEGVLICFAPDECGGHA